MARYITLAFVVVVALAAILLRHNQAPRSTNTKFRGPSRRYYSAPDVSCVRVNGVIEKNPGGMQVVPGCSIGFAPLRYSKFATPATWINLATPHGTEIEPLDPSLKVYSSPPDNLAGEYNRDHVFEVQLIASFIGSLGESTVARRLWKPILNQEFCDWVDEYICSSTFIWNLLQCLPNDRSKDNAWMPMLEKTIDGMKSRAFNGSKIITKSRFKSYSDTEKVASLRAAASTWEYAKDDTTEKAFTQQSTCLRRQWQYWLAWYVKQHHAPKSAKQVDVGRMHSKWVQHIRRSFDDNLRRGIVDMVSWWNESNKDGSKEVILNFPSLLPDQGRKMSVDGDDLSRGILAFLNI